MSDFLRDVSAGQAVGPVFRDKSRINAWNLAARLALRSGEGGAGDALDSRLGPQVVVSVRNDTGADLADFSVVTLSDLLLTNTDSEQLARDARESPLLKGIVPAADSVIGVLQEPIKASAVGRVTVLGVTPVRLQMNAAVHKFARVIVGDASKMTSAGDGSAIIYPFATSGTTLGVILLGGQMAAAGLLRGKLDGSMSFGGSATMSIWAWNGTAVADTGENVTVFDWHLKSGQTVSAGNQVTAAFVGGQWVLLVSQCN